MKNSFLILFALLTHTFVAAQNDSLYIEIDSAEYVVEGNKIINNLHLKPLAKKIQEVSEYQKVLNIVHIGDSHIQADVFSGVLRRKLQEKYGNSGRGFVFPHRLAKTNGIAEVRFNSNITWESQRNVSPDVGNPVGLSGIALFTKDSSFAVEVQVRNPEYAFKNLKIITPQNKKMFDVATVSKTVVLESEVPKVIQHKIKSGESLSVIAGKYNVSVASIRQANNLKGNTIHAGKSLKIPTNQKETKKLERSEFISLPMHSEYGYHQFLSDSLIHNIYLIPDEDTDYFALNGLVLDNGNPGILYHTIGVNGAKNSDYIKYPLFFEQLPVLNPDLVILSLGTNESFDKLPAEVFQEQFNGMITELKKACPDVMILVTTPPPSQFKRRYPNTFAADYSKFIIEQAETADYAVWDLYTLLGGLFGVPDLAKSKQIAADRVHYTHSGYEKQGLLLAEALEETLEQLKNEAEE